jgi:protein-S-isoprenylcysteine O-methyltransferase Ste14
MKYYLITLIILFYIFFFTRAFLLSKSLGKNIKANNGLVNTSIFFAGITAILFIAYLLMPQIGEQLIIFYSSDILTIIGSILITIGLAACCIASMTLKKSWRIGVNEKEKTELITDGIYRISRNPYFASYDLVLLGMVLCLLSPLFIIPVFITMVLFHLMILKEETHLEKQHREKYRKYKKEVRRYI